MRSKETNYRDCTQKKKKKTKFLGNISEEPVPSKEEAAYTFTVSEERFPYWIRCLVLRYWEDLQNTFEVSLNDAVDKENVLVEHLIKISEIPTEIPEDEELSLPIVNSNLCSITVYRTKNKIMAEGNYRQHWVRKEFPLLQEVINDFFRSVTNSRGLWVAWVAWVLWVCGFITWVCEFEIQKPTNPHFQAAWVCGFGFQINVSLWVCGYVGFNLVCGFVGFSFSCF